MATGACITPLQETVGLLLDVDFWASCNLSVSFLPGGVGAVDEGHPLVQEETDFVQKVADLAMSIVNRRSRSTGLFSGYPGLFAALLIESRAQGVLGQMKADWVAWESCQAQRGDFWAKVRARSCFGQLFVEQVFTVAWDSGWTPSQQLLQVVRDAFSGATQTKIVEDAFREERAAETGAPFNRRVSGARSWATLAFGGPLAQKYRFGPISYRGEVVAPGYKDLPSSALFQSRPSEGSKELRQIVSAKRAAWHSPSPLAAMVEQEDLELLRHCSASGSWELGRGHVGLPRAPAAGEARILGLHVVTRGRRVDVQGRHEGDAEGVG